VAVKGEKKALLDALAVVLRCEPAAVWACCFTNDMTVVKVAALTRLIEARVEMERREVKGA
jgi:hypothetical protein